MKSLHQRLIRHRSALLLSFFRLITYGCLFCLFFGLMSIHNWYLLNPSRTLATTLLTFVSMAVVMNAVYGGYAVGKKKSKPVISSMSLAIIATDVITYLQLQIMNVNENNNDHLVLFGEDFPLLLLCMLPLACVNKAVFIFLQAMGKAVASTLLSMAREIVFGVGFAVLLPVFFGLDGVLYSMPVSDVLTALLSALLIVMTYRQLPQKE